MTGETVDLRREENAICPENEKGPTGESGVTAEK